MRNYCLIGYDPAYQLILHAIVFISDRFPCSAAQKGLNVLPIDLLNKGLSSVMLGSANLGPFDFWM